jgi:hypothetical protein
MYFDSSTNCRSIAFSAASDHLNSAFNVIPTSLSAYLLVFTVCSLTKDFFLYLEERMRDNRYLATARKDSSRLYSSWESITQDLCDLSKVVLPRKMY